MFFVSDWLSELGVHNSALPCVSDGTVLKCYGIITLLSPLADDPEEFRATVT